MNKINSTTTTTISNTNFDPNYCPYKLPCGYCEKLGRDCPKLHTCLDNIWSTQTILTSDDTATLYTNSIINNNIYETKEEK